MSLPPESLSIKRRRDEDPVDCLYLQQKRFKSDFIYTRVQQDQSLNHDIPVYRSQTGPDRPSLPKNNSSNLKVPTVKATLPGAEYVTRIQEKPFLDESTIPDGQGSPVTTKNLNGRLQRAVAPSRTRRFHLTRGAFLSPSHVEAGHGVSKRKAKTPSRSPVFVEKKTKELFLRAQSSEHINQQRDLGDPARPLFVRDDKAPGTLSKRPNATEEEIAWTKLADVSKNNSEQAHTAGAEQLAVTEEMLDIVIKMSEAAQDVAAPTGFQPTLTVKANSPARPSQRTLQPSDATQDAELMDVGVIMANDDVYVYDTYLRAAENRENVTLDVFDGPGRTAPLSMQADKVGILVIDEQNEQNWEEFLEDAPSDKDWDTDDDDENAEDYYGNDYPEDELDSDDQFERNAYSYRIDASEDEEFDNDSDSHSDPESMQDLSWKIQFGLKSLGISDDSD
ncbi:MAG: hypothetical protein Q9191_005838 [Dirinaria sp. TL-2023a]